MYKYYLLYFHPFEVLLQFRNAHYEKDYIKKCKPFPEFYEEIKNLLDDKVEVTLNHDEELLIFTT